LKSLRFRDLRKEKQKIPWHLPPWLHSWERGVSLEQDKGQRESLYKLTVWMLALLATREFHNPHRLSTYFISNLKSA
jgi:hypothetical protein